MNWFKGLAISVLSIPAMAFVLGLNKFIQVEMITRALATSVSASASPFSLGVASPVVGALLFTVVQIGILMQGVKIPAKMEEILMGPKTGYKKK